jgi:hypothetical protein
MNHRASVCATMNDTPALTHLLPKMGKCYEMKHFLDLGGISPKNPQPNNLMVLGNKKSVSAVSPVPTVSFHCADNGCLDSFAFMAAGRRTRGRQSGSHSGYGACQDGRAASWTPSLGGWATAKCVSPVDGDSVGAALGRVGTNPECAVKSIDKFLMFPSRIEIKDQRKVPVLKIGVRGIPRSAAAAMDRERLRAIGRRLASRGYEAGAKAERPGDVGA